MPGEETTTTEETEGATSEETETETQETGQPAELGDAGKKALDAERNRAKAAEKRAKELESELEEFRRSQMTEQEKAIDEARTQARAEALAEVGAKIAAAEFKAAAAGRMDDESLVALLGGLDLKAFLDDAGDVDGDKIRAFVDRIAPEQGGVTAADLGQGARVGANGSGPSDPLLQTVQKFVGGSR